MTGQKTWEVWVRKVNKKGKVGPLTFVEGFPKKRWQFAIKLRKKLLDMGFQVILREITITKEEKAVSK